MKKAFRTVVGLAPAIALGVALTQPVVASAEEAPPVPCARQQAQVDRTEDALARVTAVFQRQKTKAAKAKAALERAESKVKKDRAKAALKKARERKADAAKEKKAQKQRLARATARLEACLAG